MTVPTDVARRMHRTLEPVHGLVYFAPEPAEAYRGIGWPAGRSGYFPSRAAPMGGVAIEVVVATFYNFEPGFVAEAMDGAWSIAGPEAWVDARLAGVGAALHGLLDGVADDDGVTEALGLATVAAEACSSAGRPLFAGHRAMAWPDDPLTALWHAITLVREFRGDGHVAALVAADVGPCEALVLHAATGTVPAVVLQGTRAWPDDAWAAAIEAMARRGWLRADGSFTPAGAEAREAIEVRTDEAALAPWRALGEDACARLRRLVRPLSQAVVSSGVFTGVSARPDGAAS